MKREFYTGAYSGEILHLEVKADDNGISIRKMGKTEGVYCPSYVEKNPHCNMIYAVREHTAQGALYVIDTGFPKDCKSTSSLPKGDATEDKECAGKVICEVSTFGENPCHISISPSGKFLIVSNYSSGNFTVYELGSDGVPVKDTCRVQLTGHGPNKKRQECAHVHCAVFRDEHTFYVCDLGSDVMIVYSLSEDGMASEERRVPFRGGDGPRHVRFSKKHPDNFYVNSELSNRIYVFDKDFNELQCEQLLPEDFTGFGKSAAVKFTEDEEYLLVSNRGHDSIAMFKVKEDGLLEKCGIFSCGKPEPRDIGIFEDYVLVGNQMADTISAMKLDRKKEELIFIGEIFSAEKVTCILEL